MLFYVSSPIAVTELHDGPYVKLLLLHVRKSQPSSEGQVSFQLSDFPLVILTYSVNTDVSVY